MIGILAVPALIRLLTDSGEAAVTHGRRHRCAVVGAGDGIAGAVAQEKRHLLEAIARLKHLQAQGGPILIAAPHENPDDVPSIARHCRRHRG